MRQGVATCDAVEFGDSCNCGANWDDAITRLQWRNTSYNKLAWITTESMVNVIPTTPVLAQAFFKYNTTRAFGDSFQSFSPSLWLAIWDPMLSLEESLEYGYTRLQLIDASSMVSISLDLRRMEMAGKQPAYEYQLTSISSVPSKRLTCDLDNPSEPYYGPCHVTLLIQFPTFEREVVSVQREMVC
ncbi:hypothetical protein INS49_007214 [Diaporthe citri]|uniref:uncharacterized protein n=1 Tax=Diaporthe citri TaxID=83186 RepID=UPI001C7FA421|nr:uncharacterized protein INS49_007214 [Diaporthe citri]KAG6365603.1 hypothetical protein INS49_007214 [Diaporthe citri]